MQPAAARHSVTQELRNTIPSNKKKGTLKETSTGIVQVLAWCLAYQHMRCDTLLLQLDAARAAVTTQGADGSQ
jgi:hypothetical protein